MVVSSTCRKVNKNPVFSAKSNGLEPRPRYRYQAFLSDSFQRGMADCASFSLGAVTFQEPLLYVLRLPRCMKPGWILHPCQPHCALALASRRRQVSQGSLLRPQVPPIQVCTIIYIFNISYIGAFLKQVIICFKKQLFMVAFANELEDRLAKYLDRDFSLEQAQTLVLMEERRSRSSQLYPNTL